MAYVPGYRHDVFLSYSHKDDPAWVEAFRRALKTELVERLGREVSLWQDLRNLRFGQDWPQEIEEGINGAAVFLAVVSPGYKNSDWCGRERSSFTRQFPGGIAEMKVKTKVGDLYRFLKVIKMPWEDDGHLLFFEQAQHVDLYQRDAKGVADELPPGTVAFQAKLREVAHCIVSLLTAMRRAKESVFVATPAQDVVAHGEALRSELAAQGYDLRPDGPLDDLFSDEAILAEMRAALVSTHLLGPGYDRFAQRQVELARQLDKTLVCWLSREAERSAEPAQRDFIARLARENGNGSGGVTLLGGSIRSMIRDLLQILAPSSRASARAPAGNDIASVYLLCDRSASEDYGFAESLRSDLTEKEGIDVFLPAGGAGGPRESVEMHLARLRDCDGVLLYCNTAPHEWLRENVQQVLFAEQLVKRPPLKSKAYLLDDPGLLSGVANVIPRSSSFSLSDLEPFLAPLRATGGADARP